MTSKHTTHKTYEQRVDELGREGLTTSDAQGVIDAEITQIHWDFAKGKYDKETRDNLLKGLV